MTRRYGIIIDLDRCIGCHTCTVACKVENSLLEISPVVVETVGGGAS